MNALRNPTTRLYASYAFDWIFCAILLVLFFLLDRAEPFHRQFSVENTAIMFPMKLKETIPTWALVLIAVIFPVLTIAFVGLGVRRSLYDFHNGILGLLLSILLTTMFTQVMKVRGKKSGSVCAECLLQPKKKKKKNPVFDKVSCLSSFPFLGDGRKGPTGLFGPMSANAERCTDRAGCAIASLDCGCVFTNQQEHPERRHALLPFRARIQ